MFDLTAVSERFFGFWLVVFKNSRKRVCGGMVSHPFLPVYLSRHLATCPFPSPHRQNWVLPRLETELHKGWLSLLPGPVVWGLCESHWHPFIAIGATPNGCHHPTADPIP